MKKLRIFSILVVVSMVLMLFSTGSIASGHLTIGVSVPQLDADGFRTNVNGVEDTVEEYGGEVISFSANNSVQNQMTQIDDFITQEVDAIIIIPVDAGAISSGVKKANEANIPIISMDRSTQQGEITALIESDNVAHGRAAADLIVEAAKKAGIAVEELKVLELLGDQATSSGVERHEGFQERAEELGLNVVAELPTNWQNDEANAATLDAFQRNPDINAIFEASDIAMHAGVESALASLDKLKPIGEDGHVIITSVDGGPQGLDAVREGYIDGIAAQQLKIMGVKAAELAIEAANDELYGNYIIRLKPDLVIPENVDSEDHWANTL